MEITKEGNVRTRSLLVAVALAALTVGTAAAQDAKAILQAASAAIGADKVKTIEISGTGWVTAFGQFYSPLDAYPKFEVTTYTRTIDYDAQCSREEYVRRQGNYPARGGGGTPIQGEQRQISLVCGNYAWNLNGGTVVPMPAAADVRQLDILITPIGFIKAALAANPPATILDTRIRAGEQVTVVSFTALGKYRMNGVVDSKNQIRQVQTWIPNPVLGDTVYETIYGPLPATMGDYKDFGGVKYPPEGHFHQGSSRPSFNLTHDVLDITVSNVRANVTFPASAVPDAVRQATIPPVRVESQKVAEGVWLLGGGSHYSVLIEFSDFLAVVEAPLNEQRSLAVIAEAKKLAPNKPIRYLVNTHHHFDHMGGLRTYAAQGATIVTHQGNRDFYEKVVLDLAPRTLEPDRMSLAPLGNPVSIQGMLDYGLSIDTITHSKQKYSLSDGVRTLFVYPVQRLDHASTMLMAYLPKEKILINADLYSPPAPGTTPPAAPSQAMVALLENISFLKLDVAQHVPIHGRPGTNDEFLKIVGKAGTN